jgi:hypothetical protein
MSENLVVRRTIETGRSLKNRAAKEKISLDGPTRNEERAVFDIVDHLIERKKRDNADWLKEKKESLGSYLAGIPDEDIEEMFKVGLYRFIKSQHRLYKKTKPDELHKLSEQEFLAKLVDSYVYDFILSLRACQKQEVFPTTALEIAQHSYRLNPNALRTMHNKYPQLESWILEYAMVKHSKDYDVFLTNVGKLIPELKAKYPQLEEWIIRNAAVKKQDDPTAFLDDVIANFDLYKEKYKLADWIIMRGVMGSSGNPDAFLHKVANSIAELGKEFPHYERWVIEKAAVQNSRNPRKFLLDAGKEVQRLQEKFPKVSEGILLEAAVKYKDYPPEKFVEIFLANCRLLEIKFPTLSAFARRNIARNPNEAEDIAREVKDLADKLSIEFPQLSKYSIDQITASDRKNARVILNEIVKVLPTLQESFPEFAKSDLEQCAISYKKNADDRLKDARNLVPEVQGLFPELDLWVIRSTVIKRPNTYKDFLKKLTAKMADLRKRNPSLTEREILAESFFHSEEDTKDE